MVVQLLAHSTYALSGTGKFSKEKLQELKAMSMDTAKQAKFHKVSEWPTDKGREFLEAPELAKLVKEGKLPPVAKRLPENPLVITPPDQMGPYGGTWRRFATSPRDVGLIRHRIAYESFVRWDPLGQKILPNLAVKWDVTDEGKTFTFYLRKGVRWSDGKPYTTDDLMFWYEDVLKNDKVSPGVARYLKPGGKLFELEKVDAYTIRFKFAEPNGLFLKHMTGTLGYQISQYPKHYMKQFHPKYTDEAKLTEMAKAENRDFWYELFNAKVSWINPDKPRLWAWQLKDPPPARPAVFVRNPYYWKVDAEGRQLPYIDKITFDIYDPETINLKAINGEVGMQGRHIDFKNYQLFMSNAEKGGYRVLNWLDGGTGNLALCPNQNHPDPVLRDIFADKRFRKALSYAINRDEINKVRFYGVAKPRQIAPPKCSPFYDAAYESAYIKYSPALANSLLDQMGLNKKDAEGIRLRPDGKELIFQIESSTNLGGEDTLQMVAQYWRAVGLKVNLKVMARNLYNQRRKAMVHDVGVWKGAGVDIPVLDPRFFIPYSKASIQAPGYAKYYSSGGKKGPVPPEDMKQAIETFWAIEKTPDAQAQIELFQMITDLNRSNLWVIGTIGDVPQVFLVDDDFRNVPESALVSWAVRTPGNTAPECYAIDPKK